MIGAHPLGYLVLLAFFISFVAIALWIYRPSQKNKIEKYRDIPFQGD